MKKIAVGLLIFVVTLVIASCRAQHTCPAYHNGSVQVEKIQKNNI